MQIDDQQFHRDPKDGGKKSFAAYQTPNGRLTLLATGRPSAKLFVGVRRGARISVRRPGTCDCVPSPVRLPRAAVLWVAVKLAARIRPGVSRLVTVQGASRRGDPSLSNRNENHDDADGCTWALCRLARSVRRRRSTVKAQGCPIHRATLGLSGRGRRTLKEFHSSVTNRHSASSNSRARRTKPYADRPWKCNPFRVGALIDMRPRVPRLRPRNPGL